MGSAWGVWTIQRLRGRHTLFLCRDKGLSLSSDHCYNINAQSLVHRDLTGKGDSSTFRDARVNLKGLLQKG